MELKHCKHLYHRAGFGINPGQLQKMKKRSRKSLVDQLMLSSATTTPLEIDLDEFEPYVMGNKPDRKAYMQLIKESRKKVAELNIAWIERLTNPQELLREKMTLFWANHFVCRDQHIVHIQRYNNTLRTNALGNFREFVKAISKEASMCKYLNNRQNKKVSPNENFARELMELFTLGAGNYTEQDIKEAARAFTGWSFGLTGDFRLNKKNHDYGSKVFFGKSGNFDGEEIIDIILEQKQCARFICEKVYRYFVNPVLDKNHIEKMTDLFYKSYDIAELMRFVLMSDWFYKEKNVGIKIKSPIELIVGIRQTVPVEFQQKKQLIYLQKMLGQHLLYPPNVAGWKGGQKWIDSNSLMFRLKLPSLLLSNAVISLDEKGDYEDSYEMYYSRMKKRKQYLKSMKDWNQFDRFYSDVPIKELPDYLMGCELSSGTKTMISKLKLDDKRAFCVQLMSLPEYQLC